MQRGYASLRLGRWSTQGASYFVTFCTERREGTLLNEDVMAAFALERSMLESDGTWHLHASVIMPDHVHLFCELGARLSLGRMIARLKAKTSAALKLHGLSWQPGYFEHRIRTPDEVAPILRYLLLNPVRAGLIARGENWPGFFCCAEDWAWFAEFAHEAVVEPEWLSKSEGVASKLAPTVPLQASP